ncbi:MAG: hypothetical protein KBT30_01305 [Clostridiales bacterium]|nr:hypothetical protein [Candidatus Apopatousia equi]
MDKIVLIKEYLKNGFNVKTVEIFNESKLHCPTSKVVLYKNQEIITFELDKRDTQRLKWIVEY